ncbi:integral membrane protein [Phyllosticta citriasiana]|uniref:Integral membrane protein n=1 Tax=Phyllosticta citriasiana TaxID=595635 RepID=A0ABR1KMX4_9PEZI
MILSRLVSLFLRFGQFVSAAVCLGVTSWFLYDQHHHDYDGPKGREIYTLVIAALSIFFSLIWMIPFTFTFLHYPFDLFLSLAWFASFGLLVDWIGDINCGRAFHWGGLTDNSYCSKWKADEAFAFISACFWFASFLLGAYVFHRRTAEGNRRGTFRRTYV